MMSQIQVQPSIAVEVNKVSKETKTDEKLFVSYLKQQSNTKKEATKNESPQDVSTDKEEKTEILLETSEDEITSDTEADFSTLIPQLMQVIQENPDAIKQLGQENKEQVLEILNHIEQTVELSVEEKELLGKIVEQIKATESSLIDSGKTLKLTEVVPKERLVDPVFHEKEFGDIKHTENFQSGNSTTVNSQSETAGAKEIQQLIKILKSSETSLPLDDVKSVDVSKENSDLINYIKQMNLVGKQGTGQAVNLSKEINQSENTMISEVQTKHTANTQSVQDTDGFIEQVTGNNLISDVKTNVIEQPTAQISNQEEIVQLDTISQKAVSTSQTTSGTKDVPTVLNKEAMDQIESMVTEKVQNPGKPETIKSTVQLTPETLGKVTIELEMIDHKLVGKLVVASEDARRLVEQQLKNFTVNTTAQTIQFDKLEVLVAPAQEAFDAAFNFSEQQKGNQNFNQVLKNKKSYLNKKEVESESETTIDSQVIKGRLNLMA